MKRFFFFLFLHSLINYISFFLLVTKTSRFIFFFFFFSRMPPTTAFWGEVDALVDWCESNYVVSPFIAEFWNTISHVPTPLYIALGIIYTRKYATNELRFVLTFVSIILVALGSIAFHSTLRFYAQLLDELPLILTNACLIYCLGTIPTLNLIIYIITQITLYLYLQWYAVFFISYALTIVYIIRTSFKLTSSMTLERRLLIKACMLYALGFIFWTFEHAFCDTVRPFQFHAIWHCLSGFASYIFVLFLIAHRIRSQSSDVYQIKYTHIQPCAISVGLECPFIKQPVIVCVK